MVAAVLTYEMGLAISPLAGLLYGLTVGLPAALVYSVTWRTTLNQIYPTEQT